MYRDRRPYAICIATLVLALTCLAALIWPGAPLSGGRAAAQTTPSPSPTPWQTDPMGSPGNYTLFRDDNLFIAGEVAYPQGTYPGNETCDNNATLGYNNRSFNAKSGTSFNGFDDAANAPQAATGNLSNLRIVGGSGRILGADKEQGIIYKLSDFQGNGGFGQATYTVELFDKTGNLFTHTFPAVQAGDVSHLDVAAGDLDRLRNADDQYQDEVVLVSESGNRTMQLTVLNFFNGADDNWTHCANEWGNCTFTGTARVRFGADGSYNYANFTNGVQCSYDVFGDPLVGTNKSCDFQIPPPAGSWTRCADENGTCAFAGTARVRYGADGSYNYGTFAGSVNCSNDVFGDPLVGTGKFCDYEIPQAPLITTIDTKIPVDYFVDEPVNAPGQTNRGGQVSVAVGDLDGDGKMEIAAVTVSNNAQLVMSVYRYTNDGKGNAQIALNDSQTITDVYQYADIAAGDFTGAGHDQVIVARLGTDQPEHNINSAAYNITPDANGNLKIGNKISEMTQMNSSRNLIGEQCTGNWNCNDSITRPGWVQIKAGLFKYDPDHGYNTRRRQVGLVYGNSRPIFGMIEIPPGSTALRWLPGAGPQNIDGISGSSYCISCKTSRAFAEVPDTREAYSIVAGNFGGLNPQNPAWQLAVVAPNRTNDTPTFTGCSGYGYYFYYVNVDIAAYQYTHGNGSADSPYTFGIQNLSAPSSAQNWRWTKRTIGSRGVAAVALDLDGNSLRLGAPARIVVDNLFTTDAVLQEPPKHLDWVCDYNDFLNPAKCSFTNVSRYKGFNLTYTDKNGTETSNEVSSSADTSVGKSTAKTAEETFSAGVPDILSVDLDSEQKSESESETNTSQENYSKTITGENYTFETSTDQADEIYSRTRTLVVYRYPLYGKPDPNNPGRQRFYDLTLPVETTYVSSPGDTSEWYQPIHENGNLLTYPYTGTASNPGFDPSPDYGFYAVGQEGQCSVSKGIQCRQNSDCPNSETCTGVLPGLLGNPVVNTFGSNKVQTGIEYSAAGTTGAKFLTSQTLKSSEELKFGFKTTWKLPLEDVDVGGTVGGSLQYNTNDESSWSQSSVSESTISSSTGIEFNLPSISTTADYQYKTWAYIAGGGFLKVAHSANVLGTQVSSWYAQTYGQTYDLSLNLPRKFLQDESDSTKDGVFTLNTDISRKETKSISISDPAVPNPDGSPSYIAGGIDSDPAAPEGKTLQLSARVYNLSTKYGIAGTDANLVARFELVPYDPTDATEDIDKRETIATAPIPAIAAYGGACAPTNTDGSVNPNYPVCNSVVVSATWDTTGLTPGQYRLYVVLDPNNALPNEYHEWQDRRGDPLLDANGDPVDDNRPFYLEKGQNNEGWMYVQVIAPSADTLANRTPELSLSRASLVADDFGHGLSVGRARATIHTPVRIRLQVNSDGDNLGNQHVLFFDHDPEKGGKPFAARLLRGVRKGANHLWVTYTPRKLGEQHLWARVVEHAADAEPGNNTDTLVLVVRPADKRPPRLFVTMTPKVLAPPDDRMVEVAASILAEDNQDPAPRVRLEAITYNEGNDASKDVAGAEFGTDDRQFALRAKRATRGEGPVIYEVVYSATDRAGNKTYEKAYVTVPRLR